MNVPRIPAGKDPVSTSRALVRDAVATPRIPGNDYGVLSAPAPGTWEPRLSVSVVIPARDGRTGSTSRWPRSPPRPTPPTSLR